jgi:transcriptional antiterminator NusG
MQNDHKPDEPREGNDVFAAMGGEETEPEPEQGSPTLSDVFGAEAEEETPETPERVPSLANMPDPEPTEESERPAAPKAPAADDEPVEEIEYEDPRDNPIYVKDDGVERKWYALHAYSGQEGTVRRNLWAVAEQDGVDEHIGAILVPMEEVAEVKSGEKKISKRKFFPGYVLVQLTPHPEKNPELWQTINECPGVSGFIGSKRMPVPLEDREVAAILEELRGERQRPRPKVNFELNERVKIIDGPFANFLGNVDAIDAERGRLRVMVEIFERLTSVEVEYWQVEKM